jgi:hypothetical protein
VTARAVHRDGGSDASAASVNVEGLELRSLDQSLSLAMAGARLDQDMAWLPRQDGGELRIPALRGHGIELALRFAGPVQDAGIDPDRRADHWRWLDGLTGVIHASIDGQLALPLIGLRTLHQRLNVPITRGTFSFRELTAGLSWLQSKFIELGVVADRATLSWRLPLVGRAHELVSWPLDDGARAAAAHGRLPLRTLLGPSQNECSAAPSGEPGVLQHLEARELALAASIIGHHPIPLAGGTLTLGAATEAGIRDAELNGHLVHEGAGTLHGSIHSVSAAVHELIVAGARLTLEQLRLGPVRAVRLNFVGFRPAELHLHADAVEMSNVRVIY